jgi:hypothetical protein
MAAAISRIAVGMQTIPVVIVAAKAQDGTLTLRIEDAAGATDCPMTAQEMTNLANAILAVVNA